MSAGYLAKCVGRGKPKKRHLSQAEAEVRRQSLIRAGIWTVSSSNTYFCNQCGHWHVGRVGVKNRGQGRGRAKNTPRFLESQ